MTLLSYLRRYHYDCIITIVPCLVLFNYGKALSPYGASANQEDEYVDSDTTRRTDMVSSHASVDRAPYGSTVGTRPFLMRSRRKLPSTFSLTSYDAAASALLLRGGGGTLENPLTSMQPVSGT